MIGLMCSLLLSGNLAATDDPAIDRIQAALAAAWAAGMPATKLRVRADFQMEVRRADPALGDEYFPNEPYQIGPKNQPQWKTRPHTRWVEDVAFSGPKYRNDYQLIRAADGSVPRGWAGDRFYNGRYAWVYDPDKRLATQYDRNDKTARLQMGYYLDMVGWPVEPLGKERTTRGSAMFPYRLDEALASGAYRVASREVIDGEDCTVLERPGVDRLWLAENRGWAVAQREWSWSQGGPLKRRIHNANFREIAPGAWLPTRCRMEIFGQPPARAGAVVGVLSAVATQLEANVPDDWFEPHFPDGAMIYDMASGTQYRFGREQQTLDQAIKRASGYRPMFQQVPWWRTSWAGMVLLAVATIATFWIWRRRIVP